MCELWSTQNQKILIIAKVILLNTLFDDIGCSQSEALHNHWCKQPVEQMAESKQSQEKDQVGLERFARSIPGLDGFDSWSWDTVWSGPLCPDGQDDLVSFNRVQKNVRFYGPSNFPMNMTWERLILLSLSTKQPKTLYESFATVGEIRVY